MTISAKALGKRKAEESVSSDDDSSPEDALAALQARGQAFLQSFGPIPSLFPKQKAKKEAPKKQRSPTPPAEGWGGLEAADDGTSVSGSSSLRSASPAISQEVTPTTIGSPQVPSPSNVIIFAEPRPKKDAAATASINKRAFMSSKVSKVHATTTARQETTIAEDQTLAQSLDRNDKELYKLLHTQLLNGEFDSPAAEAPIPKRKVLQARVLELAGGAKVGEGTKVLAQKEKNKKSKAERDALDAQEREHSARKRAEAEENGLFDSNRKRKLFLLKRKRSAAHDRGLGTGIGKIKNGTLTLSRSEIDSVNGSSFNPRTGKGGKRRR